jgi:hypothetical protein
MTPYFEQDGIRLFHGRWQDVAAALELKPSEVDLAWVDPMWKRVNVRYASKGRGLNPNAPHNGRRARAKDWPAPLMEAEAFEPGELLAFPRAVFWGADAYHEHLPPAPGLWLWDKTGGGRKRDHGYDGQVAFTYGLGPRLEVIHHLWKGIVRDSEKAGGGRSLGPFQMPIAVVARGFELAKLSRGQLVFSPFGGSGPEVVAARKQRLRLIICEAVEYYCQVIRSRLTGEPPPPLQVGDGQAGLAEGGSSGLTACPCSTHGDPTSTGRGGAAGELSRGASNPSAGPCR